MLSSFRRTTIAVIAVIVLTTIGQGLYAPVLFSVEAAATSLDPKSEEHKGELGHQSKHEHLSKEEVMQLRLEKMRQLAEHFGIDSEGKSFHQLKQELSEAKQANPDKWQALKNQHHAKKLEKLREYAQTKGISVERKSAEQLRDEIEKLDENGNKE